MNTAAFTASNFGLNHRPHQLKKKIKKRENEYTARNKVNLSRKDHQLNTTVFWYTIIFKRSCSTQSLQPSAPEAFATVMSSSRYTRGIKQHMHILYILYSDISDFQKTYA